MFNFDNYFIIKKGSALSPVLIYGMTYANEHGKILRLE